MMLRSLDWVTGRHHTPGWAAQRKGHPGGWWRMEGPLSGCSRGCEDEGCRKGGVSFILDLSSV